ncbi:MAG: hypothetical protein ABSG08_01045 [Terriglobales bacterium]
MKPKFQTSKRKKLSSELALEMLRNWHTHATTLCFVSFEFADFIPNAEVRVLSVSPTEVVLEGEGQQTSFDPRTTSFWSLSADDIPVREMDLAEFSRFLGMRCREDGPYTLLAEPAAVQ